MTHVPELFPYVLLRIAGGPLADLQTTEMPRTATIVSEIERLRRKNIKQADAISKELYELIPDMRDAAVRRLWITVRRNIHNQKVLPVISQQAFSVLPMGLRRRIRSYVMSQDRLQLLSQQAEFQYEAEIKDAKHAFTQLLRRTENFQRGLLLSSATIGASLEKYLSSDPAQKAAITKKERSFMEYLSRMYTKPTPFSSFTQLAIAPFADPAESKDILTFKNTKAKSHIHLNHDLYKHLHGLLMNHQEIRQLLPIVLNPTVTRTADSYNFLANDNNQEAFQRISATPSLDIFYTLVAKAPKLLSHQELIALVIAKKYINASTKDIAKYVDQLIELDFFELDLGISGIDREWNIKLLQKLSKLVTAQPELADVVQGLTKLNELTQEYATAPIAKRQQLLNEAYEAALSTSQPLGAIKKKPDDHQQSLHKEGEVFRRTFSAEFTFEPHKIWYEDTTLPTQPTVSHTIKESLKPLADLLARTRSFDRCHEEQEKMTSFFRKTYGPSAQVGILQFYRDYSRVKEADLKMAPATVGRNRRNKKTLDLFMKNLGRQKDNGEVAFGSKAVAHLEPAPDLASFAAFLQVYQDKGQTKLVLNSCAEGAGKMFSRFLDLFNGEATRQLRQSWSLRDNDFLFAEVTDASFFNANLHPRIMPYEIITPGGHAALPLSAQLQVNDLVVSLHKDRSRLVLHHAPSGKEVMAFDLGFQNRRTRSQLYRLLCTFSFGPHHNVHALVDEINNRFKTSSLASDGIVILPRVTYKKNIVLQRKEWRIPKATLPVRQASETDATYFLRLQEWRHMLGLPDEVFVRGSYYKPQYISFKNPFLLSILESSMRSCQDNIRIEEMLPRSDQLTVTGGRAVELLAQWDI